MAGKTFTRDEFVKKYTPFVTQITKGTGLLPGTVLAQGILESSGNWNTGGQWLVGGSQLSQEANNFFGIKADPSWKGRVYNINTGEYTPSGQAYTVNAGFRAYDSVEDSIRDHANFLMTNSRYKTAGVFDAKTVADQAAAIKKAGYATAPDYASVVTGVFNQIQGLMSTAKTYVKKNIGFLVISIGALAVAGVGIYIIVKNRKKLK